MISKNALVRMKTIDSCLRRRQRLWTLEDLRLACEDALYEYEGISGVSLRTVQRDIELMRSDKLGYNAPIVVKDKKYYSYDDPDYSITQLPLSKHDLAELSSAIDIIRHYGGFKGMSGQEDILARMRDRVQSVESRRQVVYIETNEQLKGLNFLGQLYDFIVAKQSIIVDYQSFKARTPTVRHVSPYLLKEHNNRWFLIGYDCGAGRVQNVALDRIIAVRRDLQTPYVENTFFEPDAYLGEMVGVTRDVDTRPETVRLRVSREQAPYVLTKPLHSSQQMLERSKDGDIIVELDVIINHELERRLLSLGLFVEVLEPESLREMVAAHVTAAAGFYNK